ncbi:DedA family protein [Microaerobacter geothermalis]|uniref:DedA family protein n=1 Tax=Microaerobacter geothermalis TaxID=674972 RepID=UPI001F3E3F2C|nr:DedA family protein [Microaerobacter geothermalis]MCF6093027.1 DedA family protein [Microaerobacter geothermalis]
MLQNLILQFVSDYGYLGIFALLAFGVIGLPIPDELLMTFAGFLVSQGKLNYSLTVLTAFLGSISGMSFSFFIGYRFGLPLLTKYGQKIRITAERLDKTKHWVQRFGKFTVTIGYFIPGMRYFTAYLAGIGKWHYHTFLFYSFVGGLFWVFTFVTVGMKLGEHWFVILTVLHKYMWIIIFILLLGSVSWLCGKNRNKGKSNNKNKQMF